MKNAKYQALLCGLTVLAAASGSQAQTADNKTALSGYVSLLQYRGDLGSNFWDTRNSPFGGGASLTRYMSKGLDLNLSANFSKLRYPADGATLTSGGLYNGQRFDAQIWSYGLGFKLKLPIRDGFFVHPYILLQPGFTWVNSDRRRTVGGIASTSNVRYGAFDGQAGLGLDFHLSPGTTFFVQAGQHYLNREDNLLDGAGNGSGNFWDKYDRYMQFSTGLTFAFGKAKDADGDGVSDKKDKCPGTPTGVKVDMNGCPLDTDGDGVADYQDKCPDVKGLAALQGCPDADGDGVADADDKCPNTPAGTRVDASGCPLDSDGDGVADNLDKCPNTPAGVKVDATGCPLDSDGDGVPDYQDKCPDRAGPASNKGCPEMKAEAKKILNEATKYINFDFNKATLKASSYPKLEQMVQILNDYPDYSLSIAGHTDSKGDDNYNLRLSYERAAAARKYLLGKGVPADRIEARGYGETKPIATNATAAGQALNRRVDFDPYLTGETNAAEAKYGPAPSIAEIKAEGKKLPGTKTTGTGAPRSRKAPMKKAPMRRKK